jgi:hypothetical protein
MEISKEKFEEYLHQILNMYYKSKSYFIVFDLLNKSRKDALPKLNLSPGFFNIVTLALVDGLILSLSKLLERNSRSFSIYKFLNICKANQQLFNHFEKKDLLSGIIKKVDKTSFAEFITELDKHKYLVSALYNFRNEFTAHLDFKSLKKKRTIILSEKEIESLLNTLHNIICKISVAFNGTSWSAEKSGTRDLEILLKNVKTI